MKKLFLIAAASVSSLMLVQAQPILKWAKQVEGKSVPTQIIATAQGESYVTGYFDTNAQFKTGNNTTTLSVSSGTGLFLAKYNVAGDCEWAHQLGKSIMSGESFRMAIDAKTGIFLAGKTFLVDDLDPSDKKAKINVPMGDAGAFIARYNAEAQLQWYKHWVSIGEAYKSSIHIENVLTDLAGNVYVGGHFSGKWNFATSGSKVEVATAFIDLENTDIFFAKYSSEGNLQWVKTLSGAGAERLAEMTFDNGNNLCLLFSTKSTEIDVDPSDKAVNVVGNTSMLAKYDVSGNYVWAKSIGNELMIPTTGVPGRNLTVDNEDNLIITGFFAKKVDADPSGAVAELNSTLNSEDAFVAKYDANGNFKWARSFGSSLHETGTAVVANEKGQIFAVATVAGECTIDVKGSALVLKPQHKDIVLVSYDANGLCIHASLIGGNAGAFALDSPSYLYIDAQKQLRVLGTFEGTANFNLAGGKAEMTSVGGYNAFTAKYDIGMSISSEINVNNPGKTDTNNTKTRTGAVKTDK